MEEEVAPSAAIHEWGRQLQVRASILAVGMPVSLDWLRPLVSIHGLGIPAYLGWLQHLGTASTRGLGSLVRLRRRVFASIHGLGSQVYWDWPRPRPLASIRGLGSPLYQDWLRPLGRASNRDGDIHLSLGLRRR